MTLNQICRDCLQMCLQLIIRMADYDCHLQPIGHVLPAYKFRIHDKVLQLLFSNSSMVHKPIHEKFDDSLQLGLASQGFPSFHKLRENELLIDPMKCVEVLVPPKAVRHHINES